MSRMLPGFGNKEAAARRKATGIKNLGVVMPKVMHDPKDKSLLKIRSRKSSAFGETAKNPLP
jgi:hypothetical protein